VLTDRALEAVVEGQEASSVRGLLGGKPVDLSSRPLFPLWPCNSTRPMWIRCDAARPFPV